jgi:hypothetical protein
MLLLLLLLMLMLLLLLTVCPSSSCPRTAQDHEFAGMHPTSARSSFQSNF